MLPSAPVQLALCALEPWPVWFGTLSGSQELEHLQPRPCLCSQAAVVIADGIGITDGIFVLLSAMGLSLGQATPLLAHVTPQLLCFLTRCVQSFI